MNQLNLKSGLLLASLIAIAACTDNSSNNNNNNGMTPKVCTADTKECLDTKHARICSKEGSEWYVITCDTGETCTAGACAKEGEEPPVILCFPGDGKCMPGTPDKSLLCNSTGTGFNATDCPTGTACVGAGVCVGVCAVGSSTCLDPKTVANCNAGTGYTTTTCSASQGCVITGDSPFDTAACKTNECDPALDGCDFVCGNKVDGSADQTKFVSICIETQDGWKWTALGCAGNEVCDSTAGSACGGGLKNNAACAAECNDGDSFCDDNGQRVVCTGGTFGAPTACGTGKACFADPKNANAALCGDPACGVGDGTCTLDGKLRPCDANGNLAADGVACTSGVCAQVGEEVGGVIPGKCTDLCTDGEKQCVGELGISITAKVCSMGRWTSLENCTTGFCFPAPSTDGRASTLCGECQPTSGDCGEEADDGRSPVRFCGNDGMWGDFKECTLGTCDRNGITASCVVDCIPGAKVCMGSRNVSSIYVQFAREGVCTDKGVRPDTSTSCGSTKSCRIDVSGNVLGCVECAFNNEFGLVDSQCTEDGGDAALQFCTAANTWGTPVVCADGAECVDPFEPAYADPIVYAVPAPTDRSYCHACTFEDTNGNTVILPECRLSKLKTLGAAFCDDAIGGDFSDPTGCGSRFSTAAVVGDCCDFACFKDSASDNLPVPAYCILP